MDSFTAGMSPELQEKLKEATTKYGLDRLDRPFEIDGEQFVAVAGSVSTVQRLMLSGFAIMLPGLGALGRCISDTVRSLEPLLDGLGDLHRYEPPIYNPAWKYNRRYSRLATTTWHYRTRKWTPERGYHWVYPEGRRRYEA
jgi:hypothetical protein